MQVSTEESGDKPCILSFYPLDVLWVQQTTLFRTFAQNGWM